MLCNIILCDIKVRCDIIEQHFAINFEEKKILMSEEEIRA